MSQAYKVSPVDSEGVVKCYEHSIEASLRTSHTVKNPGRQFYVCSQSPQCKFFFWVDELPKQQGVSAVTTSLGPYPQSPPNSQSLPFPPATPSQKRRFEPGNSSLEPTSPEKRRRTVDEFLKAPVTPSSSAKTPRTGTSNRLAEIQKALSSSQSSRMDSRFSPLTGRARSPVSPTPSRAPVSTLAPSNQPARNVSGNISHNEETNEDGVTRLRRLTETSLRPTLAPSRNLSENIFRNEKNDEDGVTRLRHFIETSPGPSNPAAHSSKGKEKARDVSPETVGDSFYSCRDDEQARLKHSLCFTR
ncbi:hypothetical protein H0H92_008318 [Tricholoma furcatifolium]|nr:hypothetical protein H0H92_008318 [Tricholoma furcatifolium]